MASAAKKKQESFEDSLKKLQAIVEALESGDLPLEESIKAFEEGSQLSKACEEALQAARKKIEVLMGDKAEAFPWDEKDDSDV